MIAYLLWAILSVGLVSEARAECSLGELPINYTLWSSDIRSPGRSNGVYLNNQDCVWNIRVNDGSKIKLNFQRFNLEAGRFVNADPSNRHSEKQCPDYVKITDGDEVLFKDCGNNVRKSDTIMSKTNQIQIQFFSDDSGAKAGFHLEYTGVPSDDITENMHLETPGYPDYPPRNQEFRWTIRSNVDSDVVVVRGEPFEDYLPKCGASPIKALDVKEPGYNQELCLSDFALYARGDINIVYDTNTDGQLWAGRLRVEFIKRTGGQLCKDICENSTDINNLKYCTDGRMLGGRGYSCVCNDGFGGRHCEVLKSFLDPCSSDPCLNNGNCSEINRSYKCDCTSTGFMGQNCQNKVDYCENIACQNGGNCESGTGSYKCLCQNGFTGNLCEVDINECLSSPCENGGTCVDGIGKYDCSCIRGFKGQNCHIPFNICDWEPCLNGGTCLMGSGDIYSCMCTSDYTGTVCSIPMGSAHCLGERDREFGSGIQWEDILADRVDVQACPSGILGKANRKCVHDSKSPTKGKWTRPDLGGCVSPKLMKIRQMADGLKDPNGVAASAIEHVTFELANATSVVKDHHGARLYPGDLVFACDIIDIVSSAMATAHDLDDGMTASVSRVFGDALDNIVDPETIIIWRNTRVSIVGEQMSLVLSTTEKFALNVLHQQQRRIRRSTVSSDRLYVTTSHLEFSVHSFLGNSKDSLIPVLTGSSGSNFVQLPDTVAGIAKRFNQGSPVNIYFAKFTSLSSLLSMKEDRHNGSEPVTTSVVNSDVISTRILDIPEDDFASLSKPVIITFKLRNATELRGFQQICAYMNMSAESDLTRWLMKGCVQQSINESHVTCYCYHMTNFAILMDIQGIQERFDDSNNQALTYISYIGGSLSILACIITIIVFEYFKLRNDRIRIHQQLAVSIICVQLVFLVGFSRSESSETPEWACKTVAILLHFFLTAMFCWMLVEGIHLYVALIKVFKRGSHVKKYFAIGWGVPVVIVGISVGVFYDNYGVGKSCWLNTEMLLVCFVPTVGLVILINSVIMVLVLRVMLKSLHSSAKVKRKSEEKSGLWMSVKAAAVLLPLLGLTWTLGFLAVDTPGGLLMGYIFTYLFTICNSIQGIVFFVFHCLLNADIHTAYERRYKKKKRLSTLTSNDLTTLRRKKSAFENEAYVAETNSIAKNSITKTFSDISYLEKKPIDQHSSSHLRLEDDYSHVDTDHIWRRYSGSQDMRIDPFHSNFRSTLSTYNPKLTNFADFDSDSVRRSSVRFN